MDKSEVEELRGRIESFVRTRVIPAEPAPGESLDPKVRRELMAEAKALGLFAPHVPAEFGGLGLSISQWSPIFQAAGYSPIGPAVLNCMAPDEGNMHLMGQLATPEQVKRFLLPLVGGEITSCFAMTEPHPGAGSDPAALLTHASKVDGGWEISGHKRFISGGDGAAFAIVVAKNDERAGIRAGATLFLVDMDTPGVRLGRHVRTSDRAIAGGHPHLYFEKCFVPDDAVLGVPGNGFLHAQLRLGPARLTHCMRWLGLARRSLDIALDHMAGRSLFDERLTELGIAQDLIAQSVIDIQASDALIQQTADALETSPREGSALSSIAKTSCSDAIHRVIDRSIQLCGGDGVTNDLPLMSYLGEVRPFRIYDGPNETHKWAIARRAVRRRQAAVESGDPFFGHGLED